MKSAIRFLQGLRSSLPLSSKDPDDVRYDHPGDDDDQHAHDGPGDGFFGCLHLCLIAVGDYVTDAADGQNEYCDWAGDEDEAARDDL